MISNVIECSLFDHFCNTLYKNQIMIFPLHKQLTPYAL